MYKKWCRKQDTSAAKQSLYADVFNHEFNLGFFEPKRDQCTICEAYKNASDAEKAVTSRVW